MSKVARIEKTYAERLDYDFDLFKWLAADDSIISATATITESTTIIMDGISFVDERVKVWIDGGEYGLATTTNELVAPSAGVEYYVLAPATGAFLAQEEMIATYVSGDVTLAASYTFAKPLVRKVYLDANNTEHVTLEDDGSGIPTETGELTIVIKTSLGRTKEICADLRVRGC